MQRQPTAAFLLSDVHFVGRPKATTFILHPQSNETAWNDQVLKESRAEQFGAVQ
jgi:hypothetical protein